MLFGTLVAPALADGEQPEAGERDHPPEEGSASVIELLVIYPEPEAGSTHIDDISDDYGETTVDGYLSRLFEHVNQNYARSGIGAEFSLLPSMQVNMSHLDEDWKKQLSLAMMNPHNSPYVDYIEELDLIRNSTYADVIVYWRESGDGGPGANGASRVPAEEDESYVHITHYAMSPYIASHELPSPRGRAPHGHAERGQRLGGWGGVPGARRPNPDDQPGLKHRLPRCKALGLLGRERDRQRHDSLRLRSRAEQLQVRRGGTPRKCEP
jgi:hypothetical protein